MNLAESKSTKKELVEWIRTISDSTLLRLLTSLKQVCLIVQR